MLVSAVRSLFRVVPGSGDAQYPVAVPVRLWVVVPSVRLRLWAYSLTLVALGGWAAFTGLGRSTLDNDEAAFAYTTDTMSASGDWIVPRIDANNPHLNATPLYNWLSCLTLGWFAEGDFRYRVWAAVFGVGCGLATLALGTLLFRAEVGFLAALILLGNHHFLFEHGVRAGVMEPGLVFFVTCCAICYVRTHQSEGHYRLWWALFGVALGLGVLMKPPAMPGFFALGICAHHLVTRRDLRWKTRLLGPALGMGVAALVSGPWLVALGARVGWRALEALFIYNSVGRAASHGGLMPDRPATFYVDYLGESSVVFGYAVPLCAASLVAFVGAVVTGRNRLAWGLPLLLAVAYVGVLSCAATKHGHYSYAAYPFGSVTIAAVLLAGLGPPPVSVVWGRVAWRGLGVAGVATAAGLVYADWENVADSLREPRWGYPPLLFQPAMRQQLELGRARLILYAHTNGTQPIRWEYGFSATETYYNHFRVRGAIRPRAIGGLNRQLADGTAAVVFLPPNGNLDQLIREGLQRSPDRVLLVRSDGTCYPVLLFNGVEKVCNLEEAIRATFVADLPVAAPPLPPTK